MVDPNHIDGDRLLQFINAVKEMSRCLEAMNVIEVKDCFLVGLQRGYITNVIEQQKAWHDACEAIAQSLVKNIEVIDESKRNHEIVIAVLKRYSATADGINHANSRLRDFVELCDRLEQHRQSGLLEAVAKISSDGNKSLSGGGYHVSTHCPLESPTATPSK